MSKQLKPISRQAIVITGASSGIGLACARELSRRGAKLVLVARNEGALRTLAQECRDRGEEAIAVSADVGRFEELERVAHRAVEAFGGFDAWINNAGVAIYGTCDEIPLEDHRRLFDTNYWGVVHGSLIAARHLRHKGGKIVNMGSVLSDRALILQGPYSASKHAVKAFTDSLRMELDAEGAAISVTLIKPSAIDTPYMEHARNYLNSAGTRNPSPRYDPRLAAKAVVYACEHDRRDIVVGFGGWAVSAVGTIAPNLTDYVMEATASAQKSRNPGRSQRRDNLYHARQDGAERSSLHNETRRRSGFLEAQLNPGANALYKMGDGLAKAVAHLLFGATNSRRRSAPDRRRGDFSI